MYQQIVDVIGDAKHCKHVDSGTRSLVKSLVKKAGATDPVGQQFGRLAGQEVRQVCTSMTPEGRTVVVLVGAAATIVYGVLNYEELEGDIKDALRRAKVPLKVPLDRVRIPGQLKLGVSLEGFEADYKLDAGRGRLGIELQRAHKNGAMSYGLGYERPFAGGSMGAGVSHSTDGNTAAFFRFEVRF